MKLEVKYLNIKQILYSCLALKLQTTETTKTNLYTLTLSIIFFPGFFYEVVLSEKQSRDGYEKQLMQYLAKQVILLSQWGHVRRLRAK